MSGFLYKLQHKFRNVWFSIQITTQIHIMSGFPNFAIRFVWSNLYPLYHDQLYLNVFH